MGLPTTIIGWIFLLVIIALVWRDPAGAGHFVATAFDKAVTFFESL